MVSVSADQNENENENFEEESRGAKAGTTTMKALDSRSNSSVVCPECGGTRLYRDGLRYTANGPVQRYLCRLCGFRFSEKAAKLKEKLNVSVEVPEILHTPTNLGKQGFSGANLSREEEADGFSFSRREDVASHRDPQITIVEKALNTFPLYNSKRRVCASEGEAKNLAEVESRKQERAAGATADAKGKLIEFAWHLKKNGYSPATIRIYGIWLNILIKRGADLLNPESLKETVAQQEKWTSTSKANAVAAYKAFTEFLGIVWKPPKYVAEQKCPFIPLESELDALIAASGKKTAAILQLLKETGMRIGEARRLCWTDVDMERLVVTVNNPEKKSNPRVIKISTKLAGMLNALPRKSLRVFASSNETTWRRSFLQARKRISTKLQNPRLEQITFHTF